MNIFPGNVAGSRFALFELDSEQVCELLCFFKEIILQVMQVLIILLQQMRWI